MTVVRVVCPIRAMAIAAGSLTTPVATAAPWTATKDRAAAGLSVGSPDHSSCRRSWAPSTEIRLGDRALTSSVPLVGR